ARRGRVRRRPGPGNTNSRSDPVSRASCPVTPSAIASCAARKRSLWNGASSGGRLLRFARNDSHCAIFLACGASLSFLHPERNRRVGGRRGDEWIPAFAGTTV